MWHLHLTKIIIFLITLNLFSYARAETTLPSSIGPTSQEEGNLLWKEGKKSFEEKKYSETVRNLQRLTQRYPASPNYLEAHLLLGKSFLELNEPTHALQPIKYFVENSGKNETGMKARLTLTQAYMNARKFHEAYLVTEEVIANSLEKMSPEIRLEALLLKAQALNELKRSERASQTLSFAKTELIKLANSNESLKGQASWLELKFKTQVCHEPPLKKKLEERETRALLEAHGNCLLEALVIYMGVLQSKAEKWSTLAQTELISSFHHYAEECKNPLTPPGKRSKKQLVQYKTELVEILEKDCELKKQKALEILSSLKKQIPTSLQTELDGVINALGKAL